MKLFRTLLLLFAAGLIAGAALAQNPQQEAIKKQAEVVQLRLQHDIDALDHLQEFQDYMVNKQALDQLKDQYEAAGKTKAPAPGPSATPAPAPAPATPKPAAPTPTPASPAPAK